MNLLGLKSVFFNSNQLKKILYKNLLRLNFSHMIYFMEANVLRLEAVYNMWWKPHNGGHLDIHGNMLESSGNKNERCIICSCKKY